MNKSRTRKTSWNTKSTGYKYSNSFYSRASAPNLAMSSDDTEHDPVGVVGIQIDTDETVHETRSIGVRDSTGTHQACDGMSRP